MRILSSGAGFVRTKGAESRATTLLSTSSNPDHGFVTVGSAEDDQEAGLFYIRQVAYYEIDGQRGEYEVDFSLRVWLPDQIRAMLETAGFGNVTYYGGYDLGEFDPWSSDLLVVAAALRG